MAKKYESKVGSCSSSAVKLDKIEKQKDPGFATKPGQKNYEIKVGSCFGLAVK
jgi:hypothetical protein